MESPAIKRALISVSNKLGLVDFARGLINAGVQIVSTGGTRRHLSQAGIAVTDVSEYTQFPEILDGRVKTLHPRVFAGILCRHDLETDRQTIERHGVVPFELVVVNLYPFESTIARPDTSPTDAIEQIDIGGPSLIRAAAKNSRFVTVACDPQQYAEVLEQIDSSGCTTPSLRHRLMVAAFEHTAHYDRAIADYFARSPDEDQFASRLHLALQKKADLRYGENAHQRAALYANPGNDQASVVNARQLSGKQLSYNNLLDLDAALAIVRGLDQPACSVVKHNNPCGAACGETLAQACERAFATDPVSAFGSVISFNRVVDVSTAELLADGDKFVEAIVAPGFDREAATMLQTRPKWKKNVRLMEVGELGPTVPTLEYRQLTGGMLVQETDAVLDDADGWSAVVGEDMDESTIDDLKFGWHLVRFVKSNAITLARDQALTGVGAGQMSRVDAVEIAIRKAGERAAGSVLASDAFFPFPDSIHVAAKAGISAIIQPGGSVRDDEVIQASREHGIPMILTGHRHFRH